MISVYYRPRNSPCFPLGGSGRRPIGGASRATTRVAPTLWTRRDQGITPTRLQVFPSRRAGCLHPAADQRNASSGAIRGSLKLSTKCRQLETPKWKLPKKFPFWQGLNVKGGIPSPLHNPPMRVQAWPHRFVYSLRSLRERTEHMCSPARGAVARLCRRD